MNKVVETKKWILIYELANFAMLLPKSAFTSTSLADFKVLVTSIEGLKTQFRKEE